MKQTDCEINGMSQDADMVVRTGEGRLRWGQGRLRWGRGEWFGLFIGGTSWFAYGVVVLAWQGRPFEATVSAMSWILVIALACWLWSYRDRVAPFHAFACVMLLLSLVTPIVWFACWDAPTDQLLPSLHWVRTVSATAACSIFPLILLCFFVRECVASRNDNLKLNCTQTGG